MKLMVPTLMCEVLMAVDTEQFRAGQMVTLPYGQALVLKAIGGIQAIKDEADKHVEAQESLRIYGGDSWFPHNQQTISHVADYLAKQNPQPSTH